jgi:predicted GNAT family N-acyltransferase
VPEPVVPAIVEITAEETYPLRRSVLRNGDPDAPVVYPQDQWPGMVHLGVRLDGLLVGTSSWVPHAFPGNSLARAVQLRGMATAHSMQGTGLGGVLLEAGCARAASAVPVVWARARDAALAFYTRHGFVVTGDGFIDDTSGLPHHLVHRLVRQVEIGDVDGG